MIRPTPTISILRTSTELGEAHARISISYLGILGTVKTMMQGISPRGLKAYLESEQAGKLILSTTNPGTGFQVEGCGTRALGLQT